VLMLNDLPDLEGDWSLHVGFRLFEFRNWGLFRIVRRNGDG
jgi:hypothetical protein